MRIRTDYRPRLVGSNMMLHQTITTPVYAESAFAVAAPKCWNALPADIRSTESEPLFKCKVFQLFYLFITVLFNIVLVLLYIYIVLVIVLIFI